MNIEQLINHRGDKRCFPTAAKTGYGQSQVPVDTTIHQRIKFIFESLHCCPVPESCRKDEMLEVIMWVNFDLSNK